jgi:hypothetical protein
MMLMFSTKIKIMKTKKLRRKLNPYYIEDTILVVLVLLVVAGLGLVIQRQIFLQSHQDEIKSDETPVYIEEKVPAP